MMNSYAQIASSGELHFQILNLHPPKYPLAAQIRGQARESRYVRVANYRDVSHSAVAAPDPP
jgi:hypothetical protein